MNRDWDCYHGGIHEFFNIYIHVVMPEMNQKVAEPCYKRKIIAYFKI